ncbi:MAG: hypothetical protein KAX78_10570, partial [Phycisphaerae bacterium]|nr:hypothetical protein [Phycisphaerae bacterium]
EDRLRPGSTRNPLLRDLLGVGLLIALGAILLPVWGIGPDALRGIWGEQGQRDLFNEAMRGASDQMASIYLLMSLGFLLALRCGAIDLSVWVVAGLGGLVTAGLINVGVWPVLAMAGGAAAGGGCRRDQRLACRPPARAQRFRNGGCGPGAYVVPSVICARPVGRCPRRHLCILASCHDCLGGI